MKPVWQRNDSFEPSAFCHKPDWARKKSSQTFVNIRPGKARIILALGHFYCELLSEPKHHLISRSNEPEPEPVPAQMADFLEFGRSLI